MNSGAETGNVPTGKQPAKNSNDAATPPRVKPPLRIDSTLHFAWGMSLNFSGDSKQVELGKLAISFWKELKDQPSNKHPQDQDYLNEVFAVLAAYLRRVGFEREVYARILENIERERKQYTDYLDGLADMTSLSSEGLILRIGSFIGVGSLAEVIRQFDPAAGSPGDINFVVILAAGGVGLFAAILLSKVFRYIQVRKKEREMLKKQQEYWNLFARKKFITGLECLLKDLKTLVRASYPNYKDEDELWDDKISEKLMNRIVPVDDLYITPSHAVWIKEEVEKTVSRLKLVP